MMDANGACRDVIKSLFGTAPLTPANAARFPGSDATAKPRIAADDSTMPAAGASPMRRRTAPDEVRMPGANSPSIRLRTAPDGVPETDASSVRPRTAPDEPRMPAADGSSIRPRTAPDEPRMPEAEASSIRARSAPDESSSGDDRSEGTTLRTDDPAMPDAAESDGNRSRSAPGVTAASADPSCVTPSAAVCSAWRAAS